MLLSAEPQAWLFLSFSRVHPFGIQIAPRLLQAGASLPLLHSLLFPCPTQNSSSECLSARPSPCHCPLILVYNVPPYRTTNHGSPPVASLSQQRVSLSSFLQLYEPSCLEQKLLLFFFSVINLGKVPIIF